MAGSAGYSGTPLPKKLGIKEGHRVWLSEPPAGLLATLDLHASVRVETTGGFKAAGGGSGAVAPAPEGRFDVILLFCPDTAALHHRFATAVSHLRWAGGLWVCWPKKRSPLHRDLMEGEVRALGLETGLVDNKVCAVDEDWSGLRFVVRREDRPKSVEEGGPTA